MPIPRCRSRFTFRPLVALFVAWAMLLPPPVTAYRKHLTQEEVSEAYYLGQRHDAQLGAFFDLYQRNLAPPREPGDYISSVVIRTPYALAVLRSVTAVGHYTTQQAWQDYQAASDEFEVIAYLDYSYGNKSVPATEPPVARDPVRGFYVQVKQWRDNEEHTLVAQDAHLERDIISFLGGDTMPTAIPLHASFRVQDIDSSDLTVEVTIPSGRRVVVTYNLEALR
jgi:hypothetical protein